MNFSDPTFDGPASSVYDVEEGKALPTEQDVLDEEEDEEDTEHEPRKKARISDVNTEIISEIELLYSVDGKLILNHQDTFCKIIQEQYPTEADFTNAWTKGNKIEINNYFEERGMDFTRFYQQFGGDVDLYDIIRVVAYKKDAMLKVERIDHVKNSNFYHSLSEIMRNLADELLHVYQKTDIFAVERKDVLKLPNFSKFGGAIKILREVGKPEYEGMVHTLVEQLYL